MNNKKLGIGLFIALIALVSGISYAYFTASFQNLGTRETTITASTMGSLKLTATEATYTSGGEYPGDIAIQKFYVEPVSKGKGVYELDLMGVIDETIFGSDVEVSLYKSIDNTEVTVTEGELTQEGSNFSRVDTLVTNGITPVYTGSLKNGLNKLFQEEFEVVSESSTLKIRENSESTAYPKYTFYLVYNYKNNGNQNNQMGNTFTGTISGKLIQAKDFVPVNAATHIMNLAKTGNTPNLYYKEDVNAAVYYGSAQNNFVYFNDTMPFLENSYARYFDHVNYASFNTLEECNQMKQESAPLLDGTIECKYNSETNNYYAEITGYVTEHFSTQEECEHTDVEGTSCRLYSSYAGFQIAGSIGGNVLLMYTGLDTIELSSESSIMLEEDGTYKKLKSDINIIGGDGSPENPYILEKPNVTISYYYSWGDSDRYETVDELKMAASDVKRAAVFHKRTYINNQLSSIEVCLDKNKNGVFECFKPKYTESEKSKMKDFFSDGTCKEGAYDAESIFYECTSSDFKCTISSPGNVWCELESWICSVNSNGTFQCNTRIIE